MEGAVVTGVPPLTPVFAIVTIIVEMQNSIKEEHRTDKEDNSVYLCIGWLTAA